MCLIVSSLSIPCSSSWKGSTYYHYVCVLCSSCQGLWYIKTIRCSTACLNFLWGGDNSHQWKNVPPTPAPDTCRRCPVKGCKPLGLRPVGKKCESNVGVSWDFSRVSYDAPMLVCNVWHTECGVLKRTKGAEFDAYADQWRWPGCIDVAWW